MWLGSTPSGDAKVVAARTRLKELVFGPGHFLEFMADSPFVTPTVTHAGGEHAPDAASVYVGWGSCARSLCFNIKRIESISLSLYPYLFLFYYKENRDELSLF